MLDSCSRRSLMAFFACAAAMSGHQASRHRAHAQAATAVTATPTGTRTLPLDADAVRKTLAAVPSLRSFAQSFELLRNSDADAALRRGGRHREHVQPWTIMPSSFAWMPATGAEF